MKHKRSLFVKVTPWVVKVVITILLMVFVFGGFTGYTVFRISTPDDYTPVDVEATTTSEVETTTPVTVSEVTTTPVVEPEKAYYDCPLSHDMQDYIRVMSEKHDIPMSLVIAIIDVESSFREDVVSPTNDYGLMQINESNHYWLTEEYGITDFFDPYENIFAGLTILSQEYSGEQSLDKTLMAYNLGLTNAMELWNEGIYQTSYSTKVLSKMEVYDAQI